MKKPLFSSLHFAFFWSGELFVFFQGKIKEFLKVMSEATTLRGKETGVGAQPGKPHRLEDRLDTFNSLTLS